MQWYHNRSPCPWHLKIVSQFAYPVSSVKSHISSPDLPRPPWGCLGPPLSFVGISVLSGCSVISFSEKVLYGQLASCLCSLREHS